MHGLVPPQAFDSWLAPPFPFIFKDQFTYFPLAGLRRPMCKHSVRSPCWNQGPYPIRMLPRSPPCGLLTMCLPALLRLGNASLTATIDLGQLGATPWKCTLAADDSFIRKGGHGGSASFPCIKRPKGDELWIKLITFVWGSIHWRVFFEGDQFVLSSGDDVLWPQVKLSHGRRKSLQWVFLWHSKAAEFLRVSVVTDLLMKHFDLRLPSDLAAFKAKTIYLYFSSVSNHLLHFSVMGNTAIVFTVMDGQVCADGLCGNAHATLRFL